MSAKDVFELFDADDDGKLSIEEFGRALRALGKAPTEKEIEKLADAPIDFDEFKKKVSMYQGPSSGTARSELKDSLDVFDRENSGCIPEAELRFLLSNMGEILSDMETEQILKDAPKNKDGEIILDGMMKMLLAV
mmetsp:Transcript_2342/g.2918  ORF Transcript_2342/g.2918 Transcript_2342/m.2918 type:complete len:135 (-) Transcript_2342:76-480(-)|eukprot:jgi/Bigna1/48286/estExt_Genewise1.C_250031